MRPCVSGVYEAPAAAGPIAAVLGGRIRCPPSNASFTAWPSTRATSNSFGLHSVVGGCLCSAIRLCCRGTFADSESRAPIPVRNAG